MKVSHKSWFVHSSDLSTWFLLGVVWTSTLWVRVSRRFSQPLLSLRPTGTGCLGGFLGGSLRISGEIIWPSCEHNLNQNDICVEKISLLILMYWPLTTNDDHHVAYCGLLMQMLLFSILFLSFLLFSAGPVLAVLCPRCSRTSGPMRLSSWSPGLGRGWPTSTSWQGRWRPGSCLSTSSATHPPWTPPTPGWPGGEGSTQWQRTLTTYSPSFTCRYRERVINWIFSST